ncbi:MAG: ABC transporter ATP-binding protein, partial [Patescibacteria group bacterium]
GMKRRVMIAKALIHDPDVLFLDEPTAGVDVEFRAHLWNLIREFKERGKTIILTTHYLKEAEELADRIAMIYDGEIILLKEKDALIREFASEKNIFELNKALHIVPKSLAKLRPHLKGAQLEVFYAPEFKHSVPVQEVFEAINAAGAKVLRVETERTDLNDIYVELIRKNHAHKRAVKTS